MADSSNTISQINPETTFPSSYWPIRTPSGHVDHAHDMREVAAALVLAAKGAAAEIEQGVLAGDTTMGLEFLAVLLWHQTIQFEDHGQDAGKEGAE